MSPTMKFIYLPIAIIALTLLFLFVLGFYYKKINALLNILIGSLLLIFSVPTIFFYDAKQWAGLTYVYFTIIAMLIGIKLIHLGIREIKN